MREFNPTISRFTFPHSIHSATVYTIISWINYSSARGDLTLQSPDCIPPLFQLGYSVYLYLFDKIIESYEGIRLYILPIYVPPLYLLGYSYY